jgi:hypothetical protein
VLPSRTQSTELAPSLSAVHMHTRGSMAASWMERGDHGLVTFASVAAAHQPAAATARPAPTEGLSSSSATNAAPSSGPAFTPLFATTDALADDVMAPTCTQTVLVSPTDARGCCGRSWRG